MDKLDVWFLTTGEAGMRAQARALAAAITPEPLERTVRLRPPWSFAGPPLPGLLALGLDPGGDRLSPPWPDLVISCGRRAAAAALAVGRASRGRTALVHVQDPRWGRSRFDLIVAMAHDDLSGANVVTVPTALNEVTPARLAAAAGEWSPRMAALPRPLLGVLLGGPTTRGGFRDAQAVALAAMLAKLRARTRAGLAISPSRRTPEATRRLFAAALGGLKGVFLWDGEGPNPYFGILALADRLVVTGDSVSMVSEAIASGKPVEVFDAGGRPRHARFLDMLEGRRLARRFTGELVSAEPATMFNPTEEAADAVRLRLQQRTGRVGNAS